MDKSIKKIDLSDMFEIIYKFPEQLQQAMEIGKRIEVTGNYTNINSIIFCGMGGSAIGGEVIKRLISRECPFPTFVCRNYSLPHWANERSLVVCFSYSGDTEETLSILEDAIMRKSMIVGISSGGRLKERIIQIGSEFIQIPGGFPPRASLGFLTVPILYLFKNLMLLKSDVTNEIESVVNLLSIWRNSFSKTGEKSEPFRIAKSIFNTVPVIYGVADDTEVITKRWRAQLEENGKILAFNNELPEMNHNEIVGYENNKNLLKNISVIWLKDKEDHLRIQLRQKLTKDLIDTLVNIQIEVTSKGESEYERLFYFVYLGDWVSYWVAILNNTDPTPVTKITALKSKLSQFNSVKNSERGLQTVTANTKLITSLNNLIQ